MEFASVFSIIILILDIYAVLMILQSSASTVQKLIWFLVVLLLPLLGLIIWYFAGPGKNPFNPPGKQCPAPLPVPQHTRGSFWRRINNDLDLREHRTCAGEADEEAPMWRTGAGREFPEAGAVVACCACYLWYFASSDLKAPQLSPWESSVMCCSPGAT
jgi:hypothetical protein